jgi:hypothetical protein
MKGDSKQRLRILGLKRGDETKTMDLSLSNLEGRQRNGKEMILHKVHSRKFFTCDLMAVFSD